MTNNIPTGHTKEDIKAREKLIKDFYAQWITEHLEKIWNHGLNKQQSHHSWSDGSLYLGLETTFAGHKGCHPFSEFPYMTLQR